MYLLHARSRFLMLAVVSFLLAGCAQINGNLPPAPEGVAPIAPMAEGLPDYRLQVGDILEVKLLLNPEFDQEIIVRPDGRVSTVLAQDIPAYGRTAAELEETMVRIYRKQLSDPQLAVIVKSFTPNRVYVLGEVNSPGEFVSVGPNLTLLQALARAGGVRNTADMSNITILRRGATEQPEALRADMEAAAYGHRAAADIRLASYDVVFVPRTGIAELGKGFEQYVRQFLPPSFGLSYSLNSD